MRAHSSFATVLVVLSLVLAGCSKPMPGDLTVADITTGRALAPDGSIVEEAKTNSFWTTDTIYVSVKTDGSAENITLLGRFTGPDGKVAAEATKTLSPSGPTITSLQAQPPNEGRWAEGDHKLEVLVNGSSQGTRDLIVK